MQCWKCGIELKNFSKEKVPFRAICESCFAWLHCCRNCKNYKPGLPNDCIVPGTEYISDREAMNFCEEYGWRDALQTNPIDSGSISKKIFGENWLDSKGKDTEDPKKKFKSLFED